MRQIQKKSEPDELTEWKAQYNTDINFGYDLMRQDQAVREAVERSLLEEQGHIDAYTEQRIGQNASHIEHLKPQRYCSPNEEVDYRHNLVACYPAPNRSSSIPYGAEEKGDWPSPAKAYLFVSPLEDNCEQRFRYKTSGVVQPASAGDDAANKTIEKLSLNNLELRRYRQSAIRSTLGRKNDLRYRDAKVLLRKIRSETGPERTPFGSAIKQALESHIQRLEYIKRNQAS